MHPPTPHYVPLPPLLLLVVLLFLTTTSTVTARAYTPQPPPNTNPIGASYIAFTTPTSNEEDVLFSPSSPLLPAGGGGGKGDVPSFSPPVIISDYACPWGKTLLCCAGAIFPGPDEEWGDYIGDCRLCKFFPPHLSLPPFFFPSVFLFFLFLSFVAVARKEKEEEKLFGVIW